MNFVDGFPHGNFSSGSSVWRSSFFYGFTMQSLVVLEEYHHDVSPQVDCNYMFL